jgi:hypothetical protein
LGMGAHAASPLSLAFDFLLNIARVGGRLLSVFMFCARDRTVTGVHLHLQVIIQFGCIDVGLFAGAMDYTQFSFPMRLMMKAINAPKGNFQDWAAVQEWAADLGQVLFTPSGAAGKSEMKPGEGMRIGA